MLISCTSINADLSLPIGRLQEKNILYADLNDVVEIFYLGNSHPHHLHPIHLHGDWFRVLNITRFDTPEENTIDSVKWMNENNMIDQTLSTL